MVKKKKGLLAVLLACAMTIGSALPASAAEPQDESQTPAVQAVNDGLELSKSISLKDNGNYELKLEAYATGERTTTTVTTKQPLDIILSEKSLLCEKYKIKFSCMIDGDKLERISPGDIAAIFGNALDNAIESVTPLDDPEQRTIAVSVFSRAGLVLFQMENYYQGALNFDGDLPVTRIDHHVDAIFPVAADMQIVATCKIYHILTADNRSAAATDFKAIVV